MGRPAKNNAEYFPHYASMRNHRKVKALRNKFGAVLGYAFWSLMLEWLTEQDGIEWEYSELECEMFAAELGVSATEIRSMVDFCLKIELLFQTESGFIYSESLNQFLQSVFEKRQRSREASQTRKRREDGSFSPQQPTTPGVSATETPQSKVKDTIVDNSKEEESKLSIEATPPPPKNSEPGETLKAGKKDLEPKPTNPKPPKATQTEPPADNYQKDFLDAYISFYESRVDIAPKITKVDAISAAELRKFLVSRCNERTEEGALNAIKYIFKKWDTLEPFLQNQVALTQINKNINNILIQVKNGFKTNKNNNSTTGPTLTEVFAMVDAGII